MLFFFFLIRKSPSPPQTARKWFEPHYIVRWWEVAPTLPLQGWKSPIPIKHTVTDGWGDPKLDVECNYQFKLHDATVTLK